MKAFLTIFRVYPTTFLIFPKISEALSKGHTNVAEHFPERSEDNRRLLKTFEEDPKMFRWYINEFKHNSRDEFDISENIDIFTSQDMKNPPLELQIWFRGVFPSKTLLSLK